MLKTGPAEMTPLVGNDGGSDVDSVELVEAVCGAYSSLDEETGWVLSSGCVVMVA